MKITFTLFLYFILINGAFAQDTTKRERTSLHFQQTIITQYKPAFTAKYNGANSLSTGTETQSSITSTLFGAARLWKGGEAYFNPEISGGAGLSQTLGVAGFPNGETFRVGSASPAIYIARLYFRQNFEWGKEKDTILAGPNQLAGLKSKRYFSFTVGKFGMADFFDGNAFSHDPRSQFMNWALMDNAGWDYPANTRGYVIGTNFELGQPNWTLRFAFTLSTTEANGAVWDEKIGKANTQTLEYERRYTINGNNGTVRLLGFRNNGKMGNYQQALALNPTAPDVDATQAYSRHKYGFGISADQYLNNDFGLFAKLSYNDGHTQTWYFTEIDRSVSFGAQLKGTLWKRQYDVLGLAFIGNGLSAQHRNYLAAGGYGFLIGDGKLNYANEMIAELYYKVNAYQNKLFLSPGYQFIVNPAYNKDRGPVHVFSIRAHVEF
jgi:high affinity Mn2+ porin